jgi:hypothetical protein
LRGPQHGLAPVRLATAPDEIAWCESLTDFYGPASRRVIGGLLRNFLDRFQITPTELLYHYRWMRRLDNQESLQPTAVQKMAALQAAARGADRRERAKAIDKFIAEAITKAREAQASRAAPRLGPDGLKPLVERIAELTVEPAERAYWLRHAVSRALEDQNAHATKLETVLGWAAAGDLTPPLRALADELIAGLLGSAMMLKDVLGGQPHLGAALGTLADLAAGRHDGKAPGAPPSFAVLATLMAQAPMPESRIVLLDRLQRELATDKALSRDDVQGQRRLFEQLFDKLIDRRGIIAGGPAMIVALARRSRRMEIVGGIEDLRFTSADPAVQLDQIFAAERRLLANRQQQGIATYISEALSRFEGDPASLRPRIEATQLPAATKVELLDRLIAKQ